MKVYVAALLCVVGIAVGQLLFKACANLLRDHGGSVTLESALFMLGAMVLYGITSIAWVLVLKHVELGKIYPLMALAFIFVPLASHFLMNEQFSRSYFIGVFFIVVGVIITTRSY